MSDFYLPINPDLFEIVDSSISSTVAINYFETPGTLSDIKGEVLGYEKKADGYFLLVSNDQEIRLDKVVTILGKLEATFDRYNHYSIC